MHPELKRKIAEVIGINFLSTGFQGTSGTPIQDSLEVLTIWCAEVRLHAYGPSRLIVGVIESNKWRRAFVLRQTKSSSIYDEKEKVYKTSIPEYVGEHYLEMTQDWDDPVAAALHSVDLMFYDGRSYRGSGVYRYWMFIDTEVTTTEFMCRYNENPQLIKLWNALKNTLKYFVELYDDDELRRCLIMPGEPGFEDTF